MTYRYMYCIFFCRCVIDPNAALLSTSAHESLFYFQYFDYVNQASIDFHCNATICRTDDLSPSCQTTCHNHVMKRNVQSFFDELYVEESEDEKGIKAMYFLCLTLMKNTFLPCWISTQIKVIRIVCSSRKLEGLYHGLSDIFQTFIIPYWLNQCCHFVA
jgi:hypothetical protein